VSFSRAGFAGLAVVVMGLAGGCTAASKAAGTTPATAIASPHAATAVASPPAAATCATHQLAPRARYVTNGMSHESFVLTVTNHGGTCTLRGAPTFMSRDSAGREVQLSLSADEETPPAPLVQLRTGETASASYSVDVGTRPSCAPHSLALVIAPGATDEVPVPSMPVSNPGIRPCRYDADPFYPGLKGSANQPG
jgi:hypothetical protein